MQIASVLHRAHNKTTFPLSSDLFYNYTLDLRCKINRSDVCVCVNAVSVSVCAGNLTWWSQIRQKNPDKPTLESNAEGLGFDFHATRLSWHCTDLVWRRTQCDAQAERHAGFHPCRHGETKALQEGSEEQEELHPCQILTETHSLTCRVKHKNVEGKFNLSLY